MSALAGAALQLRVEKPETLIRDRVAGAVRDAIADGVLEDGRRLTEAELIELTGVSRTSVREALRHLQAVGLVERAPKRGLRVRLLRPSDVEHIFEVRAALEPLAVELFVRRATDDQVRDLLDLCRPIVEPDDDPEAGMRAVDGLIEALLVGAGNPVLSSMLGPLNDRIHALRRVTLSHPGRVEQARREYRDLITAIEARDAEGAAAAARRHVAAAADAALTALRSSEPQRPEHVLRRSMRSRTPSE
jgi:DNA-binding GntR family transcriptional regulator